MLSAIFSIFLSLALSNEPTQAHRFVEWHANRKLTWNDFQGTPPPNPKAAALTSTAIKIDFGYYHEALEYHLYCRFDQDASWGKIRTGQVLAHEQGHFDIAEIYARKLNKALSKFTPDPSQIKREVNAIYDDMMKRYYEAQDDYDLQTNFSIDIRQQQDWLKQIAKDLEDLRAYANYR